MSSAHFISRQLAALFRVEMWKWNFSAKFSHFRHQLKLFVRLNDPCAAMPNHSQVSWPYFVARTTKCLQYVTLFDCKFRGASSFAQIRNSSTIILSRRPSHLMLNQKTNSIAALNGSSRLSTCATIYNSKWFANLKNLRVSNKKEYSKRLERLFLRVDDAITFWCSNYVIVEILFTKSRKRKILPLSQITQHKIASSLWPLNFRRVFSFIHLNLVLTRSSAIWRFFASLNAKKKNNLRCLKMTRQGKILK